MPSRSSSNSKDIRMLCSSIRRLLNHRAIITQSSFTDLLRACNFHTSSVTTGVRNPAQNKIIQSHAEYYDDFWSRDLESWSDNNDMLFPPTKPGEPHRPAEIYHGRALIRYSPKKMWYITKIVKNKNIDDAINYLDFVKGKGAKIIREILIEAQEIAVRDHNVEYKSNLHVVTSFVLPAGCRKIPIYHGRGIRNLARSRFCNYYVMIREGQGPEYQPKNTAYSAAVSYIQKLKMRTIHDGL